VAARRPGRSGQRAGEGLSPRSRLPAADRGAGPARAARARDAAAYAPAGASTAAAKPAASAAAV